MNNTEQLLVRACKSSNATKRLFSVHRRFYFNNKNNKQIAYCGLSIILLNLVAKHNPIEVFKLVDSLNPINAKFYVDDCENYTYYEHVFGVLVSYIRLSNVSDFEGYKHPAMFRNKIDK